MGAGTGPFLYHPTSILLIKRQAPVVLLIHQTKRRSSGLGVVADNMRQATCLKDEVLKFQ